MSRRCIQYALRLLVVALLSQPAIASAQVVNGHFETPDGVGWGTDLPIGWSASFPDTGGYPDGYGRVASPPLSGDDFGCLTQTFVCGNEGGSNTCTIAVTYRHENLAAETRTGGVEIRVDGVTVHASGDENGADWLTVTATLPCGPHTLALCLVRVDGPDLDDLGRTWPVGGGDGWEACFDSITATCEPAAGIEATAWGRLKARYRR